MSGVRTSLVMTLSKSLFGPAAGIREVLPKDRDPRDEYVVGVLAPVPPVHQTPAMRDIEAEVEFVEEGYGDEDDIDDDPSFAAVPAFSPSLDPRLQPHSMGLSFVATPCTRGRIRAAATWARYARQDDGSWERQPFHQILEIDPTVPEGSVEHPGDVCLRWWVRPVVGHDDSRRISIFLLNQSPPGPGDRPADTKDLLFQPQVRVVLGEGMALQDILTSSASRPDEETRLEEESLALLYSDRPILARGHMCSATWRSVDPEAEPDSAFIPLDIEALPDNEQPGFRRPDVRTEFLPMVSVSAPSMSWVGEWGPSPALDPMELAEMWEPNELGNALSPLVSAYEKWLEHQQEVSNNVPPQLQAAADRHLAECRTLAERLKKGIRLLEQSPDARLAFNFANRAMALQSEWKGMRLTWRPFQLAFILMCLNGISNVDDPDREVCDLLWFPTGGGKTEAYLALAAFTFGLRRLAAPRDSRGRRSGTGVAVISRYTLRLLTIQQFRRALRMVLACEVLRVTRMGDSTGWRPRGCVLGDDWLWGTARFSAGLWVGSSVTPNRMETIGYPDPVPGAIELLSNPKVQFGHGEPAQIPRCPACNTHLAIPQPRHGRQERAAFPPGERVTLHLMLYIEGPVPRIEPERVSTAAVRVQELEFRELESGSHVLRVVFTAAEEGVSAREVDEWGDHLLSHLPGFSRIESARASRPGYFLRLHRSSAGKESPYDFEICCPNPDCPTSTSWREAVPAALGEDPEGWQEAIKCFRSRSSHSTAVRVPIPAITVDEQVYARPPSLVVATVDKFARLSYEPKAASLFGFVEYYHPRYGYYRAGCPPGNVRPGEDHPPHRQRSVAVSPFQPPDLILQDELHLIDGPLGSMVGLYETAVDLLCKPDSRRVGPKYIASTATVREAGSQVASLFARRLAQFPASGLSAGDNFFARTPPTRCDVAAGPGRLYIGICAPGKGAQTPIVRIWSALLQATEDARRAGAEDVWLDNFWTLVGYFNAIRELAGATGLYRQDIRQRLDGRAGEHARELAEPLELSSRADALLLPSLLSRLEDGYPDAVDAVLATSMFGTGVDIDRLGLMVVHGQPKTTSSYIQATGRVGRQRGGLVVTFLRASRPRDLDHYEFFTGYHQQLYRAVEPVTVAPFSPRARERALGPICVAILRQARSIQEISVDGEWRTEQAKSAGSRTGCRRMATARNSAEVKVLPEVMGDRASHQPESRNPGVIVVAAETRAELDKWQKLAQVSYGQGVDLLYHEFALVKTPSHPVVLGDAQHEQQRLAVAYRNAPTSLRDVEATTGFRV